ncbi:translesion DNA synthesis-associated protein ImuA [Salinisphaera sp. RV14]|uniref:translesion DNA synthesis-associated protein ImuA n=1 Tax=unclassified Salinisphaera TaxID=2649847 RepID=UPI003F84E664
MQTREPNPSNNSPAAALEARWQRFGVHRASRAAAPLTWSSGWPWLDALLPGGGYPLAAVTEFLVESAGRGELSLLLAALKPRLEAWPDSRLVFVEPPHRLNAPALDGAGIDRARVPVIRCRDTAERVWSIEQLAAAGGFVAFVLWDDNLDTPALRRLQLASEKAGGPVFVYRDLACARHRSPAALRLAIQSRNGRQKIEVLKCRGPAGGTADGLKAARDRGWAPVQGAIVPAEAANRESAPMAGTGTPRTASPGSAGPGATMNPNAPGCSHTR